MKHMRKENDIKEGDVVLIKGDERNQGKWNVGIVEQLVEGKDAVIRAAKLRRKKTDIERAIQLLYPLQLTCNIDMQCKGIDTQCTDIDTPCIDIGMQCKDIDTQCKDVDMPCMDIDTKCKEVNKQCKDVQLDPKANEFKPRRKAAKIAEDNLKQAFLYEDE